MYIEQSAYNSLEISKITALISRRCRSELGALVAENIAPAADLSELTKRRELFEDVEKYRGRKGELPWTDGLVSVAFMLEFNSRRRTAFCRARSSSRYGSCSRSRAACARR